MQVSVSLLSYRKCLRCLTLGLVVALSAQASAAFAAEAGHDSGPAAALPAASSNVLIGSVQDPSGAIIPGAKVELQRSNGSVVAAVATDSTGKFRIAQPATGKYQLVVSLAGFERTTRVLSITSAALPAMKIIMAIGTVSTIVTVDAATDADRTDPANNQDTATMTADDLKSVPIFDGDYVATMSNFLDAGAQSSDGAGLMVDGVERSSTGVAPSAVQEIKLNLDPYSAQYYRPGRGQMEVITKNTQDKYHGEFNFLFRDAALNATNAFAVTKPPEQRRIYEGFLTGPIVHLHNTAFLLSVDRQEEDIFAFVNANTAPGVTLRQNVATPTRGTSFSIRVGKQFTENHSAYALYEYSDNTALNQNVGGLALQQAGANSEQRDTNTIFHDDLVLSPTKLNQFSFVFENNYEPQSSAVLQPKVVVQGAFTGGSAQTDQLQTEYNPQVADFLSWTHGRHQWKFGINAPNMGRRVLDDRTNRNGTYKFASLAMFQANQPYAFTIQQGQERYVSHFFQIGGYVQDTIQLTPRLTLTPGLRYDWQSVVAEDKHSFAPRFSFAYLVDKPHAMVLRGGIAVFYDRPSHSIERDLDRYSQPLERSLLLTTNLCYPDITACNPLAAQPPNLVLLQPGMALPYSLQYGATLERQVGHKASATIGYRGSRGIGLFRSMDVNAPLPPFNTTARPDAHYGQVRQIQAEGYQKLNALDMSFKGRIRNIFAGFAQYTLSKQDNNTSWPNYFPSNPYAPNADYGPADWDQRQRIGLFGTVRPGKLLNLGVGFFANSARPYSITAGADLYHDGLSNARPAGVPRNSLRGGSYQEVDLRWGNDFKLRPSQKDDSPTLGFSVSVFNVLNRRNENGFVGVVTSQFFQQPTGASDPRRLQLGARFNF